MAGYIYGSSGIKKTANDGPVGPIGLTGNTGPTGPTAATGSAGAIGFSGDRLVGVTADNTTLTFTFEDVNSSVRGTTGFRYGSLEVTGPLGPSDIPVTVKVVAAGGDGDPPEVVRIFKDRGIGKTGFFKTLTVSGQASLTGDTQGTNTLNIYGIENSNFVGLTGQLIFIPSGAGQSAEGLNFSEYTQEKGHSAANDNLIVNAATINQFLTNNSNLQNATITSLRYETPTLIGGSGGFGKTHLSFDTQPAGIVPTLNMGLTMDSSGVESQDRTTLRAFSNPSDMESVFSGQVQYGSCCYCTDTNDGLYEGACVDYVSKNYCDTIGGNFLGETTCESRLSGANCGAQGTCCINGAGISSTSKICDEFNGVFFPNVEPSEVVCPDRCEVGACCVGGVCYEFSPTECTLAGGKFFSVESCQTFNCCLQDLYRGACCLGRECVGDTTPYDCSELDGIFQGNGTICENTDCCSKNEDDGEPEPENACKCCTFFNGNDFFSITVPAATNCVQMASAFTNYIDPVAQPDPIVEFVSESLNSTCRYYNSDGTDSACPNGIAYAVHVNSDFLAGYFEGNYDCPIFGCNLPSAENYCPIATTGNGTCEDVDSGEDGYCAAQIDVGGLALGTDGCARAVTVITTRKCVPFYACDDDGSNTNIFCNYGGDFDANIALCIELEQCEDANDGSTQCQYCYNNVNRDYLFDPETGELVLDENGDPIDTGGAGTYYSACSSLDPCVLEPTPTCCTDQNGCRCSKTTFVYNRCFGDVPDGTPGASTTCIFCCSSDCQEGSGLVAEEAVYPETVRLSQDYILPNSLKTYNDPTEFSEIINRKEEKARCSLHINPTSYLNPGDEFAGGILLGVIGEPNDEGSILARGENPFCLTHGYLSDCPVCSTRSRTTAGTFILNAGNNYGGEFNPSCYCDSVTPYKYIPQNFISDPRNYPDIPHSPYHLNLHELPIKRQLANQNSHQEIRRYYDVANEFYTGRQKLPRKWALVVAPEDLVYNGSKTLSWGLRQTAFTGNASDPLEEGKFMGTPYLDGLLGTRMFDKTSFDWMPWFIEDEYGKDESAYDRWVHEKMNLWDSTVDIERLKTDKEYFKQEFEKIWEKDNKENSIMRLISDWNAESKFGYTDWYIPSLVELMYIYGNLGAINSGLLEKGMEPIIEPIYWSSTTGARSNAVQANGCISEKFSPTEPHDNSLESTKTIYSTNAHRAFAQNFRNGLAENEFRIEKFAAARPVRRIPLFDTTYECQLKNHLARYDTTGNYGDCYNCLTCNCGNYFNSRGS